MANSGEIVIPATVGHSATIIALHVRLETYDSEQGRLAHPDVLQGLGGEAEEWKSLIDPRIRDRFPWVKWILPNAPFRPITVHGGQVMRAWYDLSTLGLRSDPMDDESGMLETVWYLGAGMTLLTALTGRKTRGQPKEDGWKLAGIAPLSGRIPLRSKFKSFICLGNTHLLGARGRGHGGRICAEMLVAEMSVRKLGREELGSPGLCFVTCGGLAHSINDAELEDLKDYVF